MRRLVPIALAVHLVSLLLFWPRGEGNELVWRTRLVTLHLILGGFSSVVYALARTRGPRLAEPRARLGEAVVAVYGVGAAAIAAISHTMEYTVGAYAVIILVLAVGFGSRPAFTIGIHVGAAALVIASIVLATHDPLARNRQLINAVTIAAFALTLARVAYRVTAREVSDRLALERLNASLEQRVTEQVAEIVARARELDQLNQRLRERVEDRSRELAAALERVAVAELGESVLPPGQILGDQYELLRPIGVGGMGVVYEGRDRGRGVTVAIKLIKAGGGVGAMQRFLTEASAAARIVHPAVVRVFHVDVSPDGRLYQVLELVSGRSLDGRLHDERTLSAPAAIRLGELVASALAAAHHVGVVHRDVKPGNIMLTDQAPGVKVLDFGLAKLRGQHLPAQTEGGLLLGTPEFMAPEQVTAPEALTGAADVYALGVTLFLCLAGRLPFESEHAMTLLHQHAQAVPPDLTELAPELPPALAALVARCLAKRPEDRPDATTVAAELGQLARELGVPSWLELERKRTESSTRPIRVNA